MSEPLAVPAPVQQALTRMQQELAARCGDDLLSLTAYGSAVSGRFRPGFSDVNLLLVLARGDRATLRTIREIVCGAAAAVPIQPLIVLRSEIADAVQAFPTKFLEMQQVYRVLHGADVLADIKVPEDQLLSRCRQEAINLAWRLRRALVVRSEEVGLDVLVARFFPLLISLLRTLVYVRTGDWLLSRDEVLDRADRLFTIPKEALCQILAWRKEQLHLTLEEWEHAIGDFLSAAEAVMGAAHEP